MTKHKLIIPIIATSLLLLSYQNCANKFEVSSYDESALAIGKEIPVIEPLATENNNAEPFAEEATVNNNQTPKTIEQNSVIYFSDYKTTKTHNKIIITWNLDETANGRVQYGPASTIVNSSELEASLLKSHSQTLEGLKPNTIYYMKIVSVSGSGNTYVTPIINIKTDPLPVVTESFVSTGENCAFPDVPIKNTAVNANIFGPVPKINGVLPANMPLGVPFDGQAPGTEYIRISSIKTHGAHYYSSAQAWNADMTKVAIGDGGVDDNKILDVTNNYALLPQRIPLSSDRMWSNVDPDIVYGITGKKAVYKFNVVTGERTEIYRRPNEAVISFMGKGNIPDDDSSMVFLVRDENKIVTIDLKSTANPRPVLGEFDWTPLGDINQYGIYIRIDNTGRWVVIRQRKENDGGAPILRRFPLNLSSYKELGAQCCHGDSAVSTKGESLQLETTRKGALKVFNYDTLKIYKSPRVINQTEGQSGYVFPSYVSGRGQKGCGKGWAVMSGEEGNGSPNHPLVLLKLDGNENTASYKVIGGDLHSGEPVPNLYINSGKQKATQSPDGNSIMFDSDGGVPGGELSTYILRHKAN